MNKKRTLIAVLSMVTLHISAQTFDLESIVISTGDKVANGSKGETMHMQTNTGSTINMPVKWDTSFGGYWADGFAISSKYDSTKEAPNSTKHLFSAITYKGFNTSNQFAVGYRGTYITLNGADEKHFNTLQVTNSTYAYNSMANGDQFAKKFGGLSGSDEDSLILTIACYEKKNNKLIKTIKVALADFRFSDNSKDYILDTWKEVKLTGDSLIFNMLSSDNSQFGMNTPGYYILDQITAAGKSNAKNLSEIKTEVYPNPATATTKLSSEFTINKVLILNMNGQVIEEYRGNSSKSMDLNIESLPQGIYFIKVNTPGGNGIQKLIKK